MLSSILTHLNIPEEILDKILGCATADASADGSSKRAFVTVSRTFHRIVLPYKRRLKFIKGIAPAIPMFFEAINAGDAHALSLAPLVQELSLLYWKEDIFLMPFEKIMSCVLSFRNLTKVTMPMGAFSPAIMKQLELGKLVQLQLVAHMALHSRRRNLLNDVGPGPASESYGALSNLQSLHTLECEEDGVLGNRRHLAFILMKNLRILKSSGTEVIWALLTTDPPVQLKELWLTRRFCGDHSTLWNYLARMTSLTHLSLPVGRLIFTFQELQKYLHIHVTFAPRFADQPLKVLKIDTESEPDVIVQLELEVRQHWQGTVFPLVEYLETGRPYYQMMDVMSIEVLEGVFVEC